MSTKFSNLEYLVFDDISPRLHNREYHRAIVKWSDISVISFKPSWYDSSDGTVTLMIRGGGRLSERYLSKANFLKPFGLESMDQFFDEFLRN